VPKPAIVRLMRTPDLELRELLIARHLLGLPLTVEAPLAMRISNVGLFLLADSLGHPAPSTPLHQPAYVTAPWF